MFGRILKKDLKRRKTMNVILLLFVVLAAMFAAAAVNNIDAVTGGVEHFFNEAGVKDVFVNAPYDSQLDAELAALPSTRSVAIEHQLTVLESTHFRYEGKKLANFTNTAKLITAAEMPIRYFDSGNKVITEVEKGGFYCTTVFTTDLDVNIGDEFELTLGDTVKTLKYLGHFKGAIYGTQQADFPFLLLNDEDFKDYEKESASRIWADKVIHIETGNVQEVEDCVDGMDVNVSTREDKKGLYVFNMISAYLMMIISVILMLTGFVMLRFSIAFTIAEDFREIGVMKAVGISNSAIRRLYIIKYLAISAVGAVIGFVCSIPLSKSMLSTVSENMVLGSENGVLLGLISCAAVIVLIVLFCYLCTRRVKKLSPIDAVRNGQTGERFRKRSFMHLGRSKLPATGFLAANDVLSAPKQFSVITVLFTLCLIMMTMISNFCESLQDDSLSTTFGAVKSHISLAGLYPELFLDQDAPDKLIAETEQMLRDNGMPGKAFMSFGAGYDVNYNGKKHMAIIQAARGSLPEDFNYLDGTAPLKDDEVALTGYLMDYLGCGIGDTVTFEVSGEERRFMITGQVSSFVGDGYAGRFYSDFKQDIDKINNASGIQIRFDGDPSKEQIEANVEKLREVLDTDKVMTNTDVVRSVTGMYDTLLASKRLMMILTVIVTALIVILIERSFISKEKSEIALMKAMGISNGRIIGQHTLRFVIVAVIACIISSAVILPLSSMLLNMIFSLIGDVSGVPAAFDAADIFLVCPMTLIGAAVIFSFLTALYTRKIKASDTASIE